MLSGKFDNPKCISPVSSQKHENLSVYQYINIASIHTIIVSSQGGDKQNYLNTNTPKWR